MPIRTDWQIELDDEKVETMLAGTMGRMLNRPSIRADWEQAKEESKAIMRPAAIWELSRVREFRHERIIMDSGTVLTGGPIADVMAGAEQLIVCVCTAGAPICDAAANAKKEGSLMRGMFFEMLGTYIVGTLSQQMVQFFEEDARSQGLHISTMLSPGESSWPVTQQAALFNLVDAAQIGVSLTGTMMMNPMKSISMVMGIGANPLGSEGATHCDFCNIRDTCPASQASSRTAPLAA